MEKTIKVTVAGKEYFKVMGIIKAYAELSKSGCGIHLHYIYTGDVNKLSRIYDDHIEVKVFTGKSSLRRKLSKCNDLPIATIEEDEFAEKYSRDEEDY